MKSRIRGFSLLELTGVMIALGAMTVLVWESVSSNAQSEIKLSEIGITQRAEQAVNGYILANARLPCPDVNGDGLEDCSQDSGDGTLPYVTLGFADAQGKNVLYRVLRDTNTVKKPLDSAGAVPEDDLTEKGVADYEPDDTSERNLVLTNSKDVYWPTLAHIPTTTTSVAELIVKGQPLPAIEEGGSVQNQLDMYTMTPVQTANVALGNINVLDFCQRLKLVATQDKLNKASDQKKEPLNVFVVAYASSVDQRLEDIIAASSGNARAMTAGVLEEQLGCDELMSSAGLSSPNVAMAGVMMYRAYYDLLKGHELRVVNATSSMVSTLFGEVVASLGGIATQNYYMDENVLSCLKASTEGLMDRVASNDRSFKEKNNEDIAYAKVKNQTDISLEQLESGLERQAAITNLAKQNAEKALKNVARGGEDRKEWRTKCAKGFYTWGLLLGAQTDRFVHSANNFGSSAVSLAVADKRMKYLKSVKGSLKDFADELILHARHADSLGADLFDNAGIGAQQ